MCKFISCSKTINKISSKVFTFCHWNSWEDVFDATAYLMETNYSELEKEFYLFNRENSFSPQELEEKLKLGGVFIIGYKLIELPKRESHIIETWDFFEDLDSIYAFEKTLLKDKEIFYFSKEDNIYEKSKIDYLEMIRKHEEYLMRKQYFKGDIIITDPCYITKDRDETKKPKWGDFHPYKSMYDYPDYDGKISKKFKENSKKYDEAYNLWDKENPDDWEVCCYGEEFEALGFSSNYLVHSTLYGDWSCTTYNSDTKEAIGQFCADAGLVGVFLLDEVLKYNPNFQKELEKDWVVTLIKDFEGEVYFEKVDKETLIVVGRGNINFETRQTGF